MLHRLWLGRTNQVFVPLTGRRWSVQQSHVVISQDLDIAQFQSTYDAVLDFEVSKAVVGPWARHHFATLCSRRDILDNSVEFVDASYNQEFWF